MCRYLPACAMCRNIRTLFNFDPPATKEEIDAACLQFVRKLSGFTKPSKANEEVFAKAVEDTAKIAERLMAELVTQAPPRYREIEAAKAKERHMRRFGLA